MTRSSFGRLPVALQRWQESKVNLCALWAGRYGEGEAAETAVAVSVSPPPRVLWWARVFCLVQLRPKATWTGRRTTGKVSRMEEEPRTAYPIQARCEVYPRVCGETTACLNCLINDDLRTPFAVPCFS